MGLDEITSSELFADLWEDHVKTRRRWYELTQMLKDAGWGKKVRMRALFYIDGEYDHPRGFSLVPPHPHPGLNMPKSRKYLNMLTHGMVLNGVLEVLEKARVTNYDPNEAIEELALALAIALSDDPSACRRWHAHACSGAPMCKTLRDTFASQTSDTAEA